MGAAPAPRRPRPRLRRVRDRITPTVRLALEDALRGDGLIFTARMSAEVLPSLHGRNWWQRNQAYIATRCHQSKAVELLARTGWLVTRLKGGAIRRTGSLAMLTLHARELLAVSLFTAGLFVTADELAAFTRRQREEAAVWADAAMEGRPELVSFYWLEVLRRTAFEVEPKLARQISYERWLENRVGPVEVETTVREARR